MTLSSVRQLVVPNWPILLIFVLLALAPVWSMYGGSDFTIRLLTRALILALAAVGLNFVLGFGGLVSLMHASFFGVGAYTVAILAHHDFNGDTLFGLPGTSNLLVSGPAAVFLALVFAVATGALVLRTKGAYFIMMTLALNQMLFFFMIALQQYGGEDGMQIYLPLHLSGYEFGSDSAIYYTVLIVLALFVFLLSRLVCSRFGNVIRASSENEERLTAIGISPFHYKLVAFTISGAVTAFAGVLWAISQEYVSPADLSWIRSADLVVIAVLGGLVRVWGPLVGALVFVLAEYFLSDITVYWQLVFGLGIIAVVVLFPGGMLSVWATIRKINWGRAHDA